MQLLWQGYYLDGTTAARQPVKITLTPTGVQFTKTDGNLVVWLYSEMRQTQGFYAGEQVRLERGSDPVEALIISDTAFLHALQFMAAASSRKFHNPSARKRRSGWIIIGSIAVGVGLAAAYLWGIPAGANLLANHIPPAWEATLGKEVVKQLTVGEDVCTEPPLQQSIDQIIQALNSAAPKHPYIFHVFIVKGKTINALAAPGGYLIIFTGLLEQTKSAEELAGVLAHEMQHVLQKHATRGILQNLSITALATMIVVDPGVISDVVRTMGSLRYSRIQEEEADQMGMDLIIKSRINPYGMVAFFDILNKKHGNEPDLFKYVSTHPLMTDRMQKLKARAETASSTPVPLLPTVSWPQMAKACSTEDQQTKPHGKK